MFSPNKYTNKALKRLKGREIEGKIYMLNIKVNDDYKLTSDGLQIIIQRRYIVDPSKAPGFKKEQPVEKHEEFRKWKYCSRVEQALDLILQQNIFESDAMDLKELKNEIVSFKKEIEAILS